MPLTWAIGLVVLSLLENKTILSVTLLNVNTPNFLIYSVCLPLIPILLPSAWFIASVDWEVR